MGSGTQIGSYGGLFLGTESVFPALRGRVGGSTSQRGQANHLAVADQSIQTVGIASWLVRPRRYMAR